MAILSGVGNAVIFLDNLVAGVYSSGQELYETIKSGDKVGILHTSIEHIKAYLDGTSTIASATDTGTSYAVKYAKYLPFTVNEKAVHFLEGITTAQLLAGVGIAVGALTILISSIAIYRQTEVLSVIPDNLDDNAILSKTLEDLSQISLKKSLPEHLKPEISKLEQLKTDVIKSDPVAIKDAKALVTKIQDYVSRKRVVEILTLLGGVVALAASVALIVGCPPLALTALTVVGLALTIACYALSKGWVENTEAGFNWKLCLPEFIRPADAINTKQGITQQIATQTNTSGVTNTTPTPPAPAATTSAALPAVAPTSGPVAPSIAAPAPKEPNLWNKFVGFFKKDAQVNSP